jgi:hypothetical protein
MPASRVSPRPGQRRRAEPGEGRHEIDGIWDEPVASGSLSPALGTRFAPGIKPGAACHPCLSLLASTHAGDAF